MAEDRARDPKRQPAVNPGKKEPKERIISPALSRAFSAKGFTPEETINWVNRWHQKFGK